LLRQVVRPGRHRQQSLLQFRRLALELILVQRLGLASLVMM
jgi:hypothetical protein